MPAMMIGPKSSGRSAASDHHRPAGLAVADDAGLAVGLGVAGDHRLEEDRLGAGDVLDGLAGHRVGQEADEVAGWPAFIATPISLSALKPPMPGPWPARGSTTTKGRFRGSIVDALGRDDAGEHVVDRARRACGRRGRARPRSRARAARARRRAPRTGRRAGASRRGRGSSAARRRSGIPRWRPGSEAAGSRAGP